MSNVTPGLVCAHHHLYSELARGMPAPPEVATDFQGILVQVWWRLDAALDLEMLKWSAKLGDISQTNRIAPRRRQRLSPTARQLPDRRAGFAEGADEMNRQGGSPSTDSIARRTTVCLWSLRSRPRLR